jgi:hypothetical protein
MEATPQTNVFFEDQKITYDDDGGVAFRLFRTYCLIFRVLPAHQLRLLQYSLLASAVRGIRTGT